METSDEWILQRTGIRERHIVDPGVATSDLAKEAALKAIAQAGLTPARHRLHRRRHDHARHDVSQHRVPPAEQDRRRPHAWGFDLGAACSGFTYALTTAAHMVAAGTHRHALAVGADVMSSIIDYTDRSTCVLFGDGAGAVVVSPAADDGAASSISSTRSTGAAGRRSACRRAAAFGRRRTKPWTSGSIT